MQRLTNKVAIVTGGADGIGRATAERFLAEGATVVVWDVNAEKGHALVSQNSQQPVSFMQVNIVSQEQVSQAVAEIVAAHGRIDILVNNAGITRDSTLRKMNLEQWQQVIDVNLTGVYNCTREVINQMLEQGSGRILTTSSVVGLYGNFGQTNYAATKFGVIGMTKTWAKEFGRKGITANAVAPGFIETEMVKAMPENVLAAMRDKVPAGRLGKPEEIAAAFAFLASDDAAYINGCVLSVDGGITL